MAVSIAGVLNGKTVTAIAAGEEHSLALANGHVYAWGWNASGQLGNNSSMNSSIPVAVSSATLNSLTVTSIAASESSSYALTSTGRLFAWGDNSDGELGIGSLTYFATPQEVLAPSGYYWTSIDCNSEGNHVIATVAPVPEPFSVMVAVAAGAWTWRSLTKAKSRN